MFFGEENNDRLINKFVNNIKKIGDDGSNVYQRANRIKTILEFISKNPSSWDERCKNNISWIGGYFLEALQEFDNEVKANDFSLENSRELIGRIYTFAFRFLMEFDFMLDAQHQLSMELNLIKNKCTDDIASPDLSEQERSQLHYAIYLMPASIMKNVMQSSELQTALAFKNTVNDSTKIIEDWEKKLEQQEMHAKRLEDKLSHYKTAFNFVGLNEGFDKLRIKKRNQAILLSILLVVIGVISTAIPIFYSLMHFSAEPFKLVLGGFVFQYTKMDWIASLSLISVEIIIIYYFRVILAEFKASKTLLMQIELRQALCQFIQDYAEYAKEIKASDSASLEKFENLIFSGITSNPDTVPATFDGLEQIGKLIKTLKSN